MPNLVLVPQSEVLTPIFQVSCPTKGACVVTASDINRRVTMTATLDSNVCVSTVCHHK